MNTKMRDLVLVEIVQDRRDRNHALRHRLDHHHGGVDAEQRISRLLHELNRARTVQQREIAGLHSRKETALTSTPICRFRASGEASADGRPFRCLALARNGAGDIEQVFQQRRLA